MISFDEAIAIISEVAQPLGTERVAIGEAGGRVLAAPVIAAIDSPRADVSAMDGYAVRSADLGSLPAELRVVGQSFPGDGWQGMLARGDCVRIFTGAPLPSGADRVVIQEQARRQADIVLINEPGSTTWVRARARDFARGDVILTAGEQLDPAGLIAVAGADVAEVDVHVRPRLALVATGDELVEPGQARRSDIAVPDSVSPGLALLAEQWGARIDDRRRFGDDLATLEQAAREVVALADVVVVTGGASVGDRDFAKAMFEPLGLDLHWSKISMRPGKPAWFGKVGSTLVLGLPGNPTSALVTGRILLAPLLAVLGGQTVGRALDWEPALLDAPIRACDDRETFHRAKLTAGRAALLGFQESHAQKALAAADVLVRQAAGSSGFAAGDTVQVLRL